LLAVVLFISGMSTGILSAFNGLVSSVYPTSIRGTALGFVLGIGRAGSIVGSMAGGALLGMGWSAPELYRVPAAAAGVTILCMVLLTILPWPRQLIAQKAP
jgi:AAHS family 4-hydroxybenzoate transporter-like MFS transporter